jgi:hypothetical protein
MEASPPSGRPDAQTQTGPTRHRLVRTVLRWETLKAAVQTARAEELVRGVIAGVLVVVLIWLVVDAPNGADDAVVASVKTLGIAVIAFYFGLHKGTPQAQAANARRTIRRPRPDSVER